MFDISLNENFLNIVRGKRVAIIGPSPHLTGKGLGKEIDEYDVVCRVNDIIPVPELRKDYGSRTDILFHNCGTDWMSGLIEKIETGDARHHWENLKMVVCPTIKAVGSQNDYLGWPDDHISDVVGNFDKVNYSGIPFYWLGVKNYKTLWSAVGVEPNCGILAIMISLSHDVCKFLISGFSFYKQGTQEKDVYYKGHQPKCLPKKDSYSIGHQQDPQIQLFQNVCKSDQRIIVDSYMNTLLELNHKNILEIDR